MTSVITAALIAVAIVLCVVAVAVLRSIWHLETKTVELLLKFQSIEDAVKLRLEAVEGAVCVLTDAIGKQDTKIAMLDNKWSTAHRLVEKVASLDRRLVDVEAICHVQTTPEDEAP